MSYLIRKGDIPDNRRIEALERRIDLLENMVNALQSEQRPKMGRPPKVKDEPRKTESDHLSGD
ncbi:MAG: hypothetical protein ACO23R_15920 [bacterium]